MPPLSRAIRRGALCVSMVASHGCATPGASRPGVAEPDAPAASHPSELVSDEITLVFTSQATASGVLAPGDSQPLFSKRSPDDVTPRLSVRITPASEARDVIDEGADVLVTDDPAAINYAHARTDLVSVPLPWSRTYVLLTRQSAPPDLAPDTVASRKLRAALARDVVKVESRGAEVPFWWDVHASCADSSAPQSAVPDHPTSRVVYRLDDATAAGLAKRVVAMANMGSGDLAGMREVLPPELRAAGLRATVMGLSPTDFSAALLEGRELGYVTELPTRAHDPCGELQALERSAPWLSARASILALVETRSRAIIRPARVTVVVAPDGALHLALPPRDGQPPR
jgi:hypothetical protein